MGAFVYILKCADRSYYVGCATGEDLEMRIAQHNQGYFGGYTATRRPVQLMWSQYFDRVNDANTAERQIKGWGSIEERSIDPFGLGRECRR